MNSMKIYKLICFAVLMLGLLSCDSGDALVDVAAGVNLRYNNGTEHQIQLVDIDACKYPQENLEILPGKYVSLRGYRESYNQTNPAISEETRYLQLARSMPSTITVVWDGEYSLTYDRTNHTDKLLVPERYSLVESTRKILTWHYEYTFTEEDYEYAKTNGVKLENSVE